MQQQLPTADPIFLIETNKIKANPYQPRKSFDDTKLTELANSIRELGILQPLVVTKVEEETEYGTSIHYELIAGERRLRAAQLLHMPRVPAIIKSVELDQHKLEMALVENIQRSNLNPIESARAYNRLQDEFNLTQREIASRLGKSREVVANTMRLLNLPSHMQEAVAHEKLSESQARILLSIDGLAAQEAIFSEIINKNLSVREVKQRVAKYKQQINAPQKKALFQDPQTQNLQKALEDFLGAQVKLDSRGGEGRITIPFKSAEELQALVEKMTATSTASAGDEIDEMIEQITPQDQTENIGLNIDDSQLHTPAQHEQALPAVEPEHEIAKQPEHQVMQQPAHEVQNQPPQEVLDHTDANSASADSENDPFAQHGF